MQSWFFLYMKLWFPFTYRSTLRIGADRWKLHFALRAVTSVAVIINPACILYWAQSARTATAGCMNPWWGLDSSLHRYWPESLIIRRRSRVLSPSECTWVLPARRPTTLPPRPVTHYTYPEKIIITAIEGTTRQPILYSVYDMPTVNETLMTISSPRHP